MNESMELILIEALDQLDQGLKVEEILANFPQVATELRPFLMTAAALPGLAAQPSISAENRSKTAFLAEAERMATAAETRSPRLAGGWWRRLALPLVALVAVLFLGTAGLAGASAEALPGDALYGAKRLVEDIRLSLTNDPERAADLRETFRQERIREIEALLVEDRAADVELTGEIEIKNGSRWQVAGVPVTITAGTVIDGPAVLGAQVRVEGQTAGDVVNAERVTVLSAVPRPTPDLRPLFTPQASTTPAPADDNDDDDDGEEIPGSQPLASPAATATPAPTLSPSATPRPAPTATPDDDDDDNDDDDSNDNGDDDGDDDDGGNDDSGGDDDGGGDDNANENNGNDDRGDDDDGSDDTGGDDGRDDEAGNNDNGDDDGNDNEDDNDNDGGGDEDDNGDDGDDD